MDSIATASDSNNVADLNDFSSISELLEDIDFEASTDFDFDHFEEFTNNLLPSIDPVCSNQDHQNFNVSVFLFYFQIDLGSDLD